MSTGNVKKFSERLSDRIKALGIKKKTLAEKAGIAPQTLTGYINGEHLPGREASRLLARELKCSEVWLLGETDENTENRSNQESNARIVQQSLYKVPGVSWATAGKGRDFEDLCNQMEWEIDSDCSDPNAFALEVDGSSMAPMFRHGERVVVSPNRSPGEGKPAFVRLKDGRTFFKLYHESGDNEIRLESANPSTHPTGQKKFEDLIIHKGDIEWIYPAWGRIERFID